MLGRRPKAKKKAKRRTAFGTLVDIGLYVPRQATKRGQEVIRTTLGLETDPSAVIAQMANQFDVSQKEMRNMINERMANVSTPAEAISALQDLAMKLPSEGFNTTRRMTAGSLLIVNDFAARFGLPTEAFIGAMLGIIGTDWQQLTRRQRERLDKALQVVEEVRVMTEQAERDLVDILGPEHPISWEEFSGGVAKVQRELKTELHQLKRAPFTVAAAQADAASPGVTPTHRKRDESPLADDEEDEPWTMTGDDDVEEDFEEESAPPPKKRTGAKKKTAKPKAKPKSKSAPRSKAKPKATTGSEKAAASKKRPAPKKK